MTKRQADFLDLGQMVDDVLGAQPDRAKTRQDAEKLIQTDISVLLTSLVGNVVLALFLRDRDTHLFIVGTIGLLFYAADRLWLPGNRTTEIIVCVLLGAISAPVAIAMLAGALGR